MKLNEIKQLNEAFDFNNPGPNNFCSNRDEVLKWLTSTGTMNQYIKCSVSSDGVVEVKGAVSLSHTLPGNQRSGREMKYLPVKFASVTRDFRVWDNDLRSLQGAPEICGGDVCISNNPNLMSLRWLPTSCRGLTIDGIGIYQTSLIGLEDDLKGITINGSLSHAFHNIKEGGINLILIKGLTKLRNTNRQAGRDGGMKNLPDQFKIIEKYLGRPDDIFECQNELIENGFEEYAKL